MPQYLTPAYDVRIYAPDGTRRKISPNAVQPRTAWKNVRYGGYADASLVLSGKASELSAIRENDRVRIYVKMPDNSFVLRYSGFITQTGRTVGDPITLSIVAQGMYSRIAAVPIDARYINAFPVDVINVFSSFANIEAKTAYPALNIDIQSATLGITAQTEDAFNKSLGDAFKSLSERFEGLAAFGCDELPTTVGQTPVDRLYLRSVSSRTTPDFTLPVPGIWQGSAVAEATGGPDVSKLANIVTVTGADNLYPNLLASACKGNVGFEKPVLSGANNANRLQNASFDYFDGNYLPFNYWTITPFPSGSPGAVASNGGNGNTRTGYYMAYLFTVGQTISQRASDTVTAGDTEIVGVYARRGLSTSAATFRVSVQFYNVSNATVGSAINTDYAPDASGGWKEFSAPYVVPATASYYIVTFSLLTTTGPYTGIEGVMLDDTFAYRAALSQDGWQTKKEGSATFNSVEWATTRQSSQGRYSVALDVSASDTDGQDARLEPASRFAVVGNTTVRFAADMRSWDGTTAGKVRMEIRFYDSAGNEISGGYGDLVMASGAITATWSQRQFTATAPGNAASAAVRITFRGNSKIFIDRMMVRNSSAPVLADGSYEWVDDGPYRQTFRVTDADFSSSLSTAAKDSITTYGARYNQIQSDAVNDRTTAVALLTAYLNVYAVALYNPIITIADSPVTILPGQTIRLAGELGAFLSGAQGKALMVAEVSESVEADGSVLTTLSLEVEKPTIERLVMETIKKGKLSSTGGGVSSFTPTGGSAVSTPVSTAVAGSGLTSVGLTMPGQFTVSGSPLTANGTIGVTLNSQSANLLWASPDGASGAPSFRTLALADIPNLLITGAKIANTTVTVGKLSATGTADSTTFLRGDGAWATPSGGSGFPINGVTTLSGGNGSSYTYTLSTSNKCYDISSTAGITIVTLPTMSVGDVVMVRKVSTGTYQFVTASGQTLTPSSLSFSGGQVTCTFVCVATNDVRLMANV